MNSNLNSDADYLWDKTGEPDPEIQQLEEILGTLRYQPRPLEIPAGLHIDRRRSFLRSHAAPLAIAATVALTRLRSDQCPLRVKTKTRRWQLHRLSRNRNGSRSLLANA